MGYFQVRYDSRVVNYERKLFIRLTTELETQSNVKQIVLRQIVVWQNVGQLDEHLTDLISR